MLCLVLVPFHLFLTNICFLGDTEDTVWRKGKNLNKKDMVSILRAYSLVGEGRSRSQMCSSQGLLRNSGKLTFTLHIQLVVSTIERVDVILYLVSKLAYK